MATPWSEPDHEIGDLQELLWACWRAMSTRQRQQVLARDLAARDWIEHCPHPGAGPGAVWALCRESLLSLGKLDLPMLWYTDSMAASSRKGKTTSILLDEPSKLIITERDPDPNAGPSLGNRSVIIREIFRRYDWICRRELPALSSEEKKLLREAGRNGGAPDPSSLTALMDALRRLGDAGQQLETRILGLPAVQQIAVLDDVERYWASKRQDQGSRAVEEKAPRKRRHA